MFFLASKIFWALAQPSNLLLLLLAAGALALLLGRRRLASWLLYPAVLVFLLVGLFPVGEWLILPLENRFPAPAEPPDEVDGIIVLGGAVDLDVTQARGMVAFHGEAERDITLLELARRYPDAELIYTGSSYWPPFLRHMAWRTGWSSKIGRATRTRMPCFRSSWRRPRPGSAGFWLPRPRTCRVRWACSARSAGR